MMMMMMMMMIQFSLQALREDDRGGRGARVSRLVDRGSRDPPHLKKMVEK